MGGWERAGTIPPIYRSMVETKNQLAFVPRRVNLILGLAEADRRPKMTMRVIDVAPNEAAWALLVDRLEKASSGEQLSEEELATLFEFNPAFRDAATKLLQEK